MDNVIDFINVNRDRYVDELKHVPRDPEHQRAARARGRRRALRRMDAPTRCARIGMQNVRLIETPGNPVVYGDWLGAPGAPTISSTATTTCSRSIRWICGRRRRSRRRSATARSTRAVGRRQGPGLHALQGRRGAPEAERPAAGEHEVHSSKARRKSAARTSTTSSARTRTSSRPTSSSSPTRRCSTAACRRSATACAASCTSRSTSRQQDRSAFGIVRRRGRESGVRARRRCIAQMKDAAAASRFRASTTMCGRWATEERAGVGEAAVQREAVPEGLRRPEAVWRDRLHHARADVGAADVRGERTAVRIHGRRRQDRAARRRDGQGQHASGPESGSGQDRASCSRPTCRRSRRRPWS